MVVSNRYALSLFEIANEDNILDVVCKDISQLSEILKENAELYSVLSAPNINLVDKIAIFEKVFKGKINDIAYNFIAVLIEKSRINLFFEIKDEFINIYNQEKQIVEALVTTAIEIDEELSQKVLEKIKNLTKKDVKVTYLVDESIMGGVIIKYDNTLIDDSVRTRLENLNKKIKEVGV